MIILIHGQNEVDSRRFLVKLKSGYSDVQTIEGKNLKRGDLEKRLLEASNFLFGEKLAFLIENFSGDEEILQVDLPPKTDLILWADKKVPIRAKNLKSFLFDRIEAVNSFKLADAILLKKEVQSQLILHKLLVLKEPPERIMGAISRSLALALAAKDGSLETAKLSPFVKERNTDLSRGWSRSSIKKGLLILLQADISMKKGAVPKNILSHSISKITDL